MRRGMATGRVAVLIRRCVVLLLHLVVATINGAHDGCQR